MLITCESHINPNPNSIHVERHLLPVANHDAGYSITRVRLGHFKSGDIESQIGSLCGGPKRSTSCLVHVGPSHTATAEISENVNKEKPIT